MINNFYKLFTVFFVLLCHANLKAATSLPIQQLASPIPEKFATQKISEEFLLNSKKNIFSNNSIDWLDNDHIISDLNNKIELCNVINSTRTTIIPGSNPIASPNGEWIAYIAEKDNVNQIWVIKKDGSEKKQITNLKEGLVGEHNLHYGFAWSLDSSHLAYYVNPINTNKNINSLQTTQMSLPPSVVFVVDMTNGITKEIYSDFDLILDLSWYPDGKKLLMSKFHRGFLYNEDADISWIQSVSLNDGQICILAKFNGLQGGLFPEVSPNGLQVSFLYNAENDLYDWMPSIGVIESTKKDDSIPLINQLTFDIKILKSKWSKNGREFFALRNYGAYNQIYSVNSQSGGLKQITTAPLNIVKFGISRDGLKLAWMGWDAHGSHIVRVASSDGSNVKDLIFESAVKDDVALSEVREIEWKTIDYPSKMRGLLFLPNNYKEGTQYPLIIDIHGGGSGNPMYLAGSLLVENPLEWQLWTAKGYAVFVPEFRSSASFGFLAILRDDLEEHDLINCDMMDIISGLDELVKMGIVDNNRVAAIGYSAGARRANWITVASNRFRVIISKEGWADEWSAGMKFPGSWKQFGGSPTKVPENYLKNSALFHSKGASTPTLFLMGNPSLGGADSFNTVYKLYEALKAQGVETEYVQYSDEGHDLTLEKNRRDALNRTMQSIDRYTTTSLK